MATTTPPPLAADLTAGLRRLKLAAMRRLAPELLVTARTQRWNPEEFLRTLIEAEITARDEVQRPHPDAAGRVLGHQDSRRVRRRHGLIHPRATFDYLASLEWIRAAENTCLIGPGTGKSHVLVALGVAAVQAGHKVRYFTAAVSAMACFGTASDGCLPAPLTTGSRCAYRWANSRAGPPRSSKNPRRRNQEGVDALAYLCDPASNTCVRAWDAIWFLAGNHSAIGCGW